MKKDQQHEPETSAAFNIRKLGEKYQARIAVNKKTIYLGMHATAEGALAVYLKARLTHFGEFA